MRERERERGGGRATEEERANRWQQNTRGREGRNREREREKKRVKNDKIRDAVKMCAFKKSRLLKDEREREAVNDHLRLRIHSGTCAFKKSR